MRWFVLFVLTISSLITAVAKDSVKGRIVCGVDKTPVAHAVLAVEYPDTILYYEADRKGRFKFEPLVFPLTIAVKGEGMENAVFALMSRPHDKLVLELKPDPSSPISGIPRRKPDWTTATPRRLTSTYTVRSRK